MATITFQNLFRLYKKLGGMTGTAETEASEFMSTYKLDVVTIPTNKQMIREDHHDIVYKTEREKFNALIKEILQEHEKGRPVLVGTTSVEKSGAIARILKKKGVPHEVLNAKHHENEAFVVAQAGRRGAITVSTNMAGRGTDIMLGGNPEMLAAWEWRQQGNPLDPDAPAFLELVKAYEARCAAEHDEVVKAGGLHIVGTERHESRRIDNQLRGRAGRQGDPGSSRFYLSLEDDLMRIFSGDAVKNLMDRMGMPDDEPIEHPMVTRSIENAQRKVEERNFDIRKNLLEYDDVMNAQRKTVYALRQSLLLGRYEPEELDELGKPTGEARAVPVADDIGELVTPLVAQLCYMFVADPQPLQDAEFKPRKPRREDLIEQKELVETEALQHEAYQLWGVRVAFDDRKQRTPLDVHDELLVLALQGLSEQRERMLDLIDRVVSAMVEECCPPNRLPEDWDFAGIRAGFREHFRTRIELPVEEYGDRDRLVRDLYVAAEAAYHKREAALGVDLTMRVFRFEYLRSIDEAWVDHLSNMEHLRDGIGLRGYGQRDPKNEYKKEGYDLFITMMAKVSSTTLTKVFEYRNDESDIEELERAAEERAHAALERAVARHPGEPAGAELPDQDLVAEAMKLLGQGGAPSQPAPPSEPPAPTVTADMVCPCGSGKPFKECHGESLDDTAA